MYLASCINFVLDCESANPTYGALIDLLSAAEQKYQSGSFNSSLSDILLTDFKKLYPSILIGRADRFLDTVRRIATPTIPSATGTSKLVGSPLRTYFNRTWTPRIRNKKGKMLF